MFLADIKVFLSIDNVSIRQATASQRRRRRSSTPPAAGGSGVRSHSPTVDIDLTVGGTPPLQVQEASRATSRSAVSSSVAAVPQPVQAASVTIPRRPQRRQARARSPLEYITVSSDDELPSYVLPASTHESPAAITSRIHAWKISVHRAIEISAPITTFQVRAGSTCSLAQHYIDLLKHYYCHQRDPEAVLPRHPDISETIAAGHVDYTAQYFLLSETGRTVAM